MPPFRPEPVTLAEVVRRAAEIVDPDDDDPIIGDFQARFEDADEPIRAIDDLEARVGTALEDLDPALGNGSLAMAGAVTVYLGYRRDEVGAEPAKLLRLAAEAEWDGRPPEVVVAWLADRDIRV
ncbi:MAG: hypothetical protein JOZ07_16245 [Solirubrobacterales bacterium]|nr:hypothetical protein [Solirubrobacterales bacterium]